MDPHQTAPEDRIPFGQKVVYGLGAFVNNLLASAIGGMVIVLNLGFGMNPALVGIATSIPRLTDAITDPVIGYSSDNTRSRWGRRRPYIFIGAIAAGITFVLLWQLPIGKSDSYYFWYFLSGSIIFFFAYTVFVTPWVALGYELTPDYNERTRLMGVQNFIGQPAYLIAPWFVWIMQNEGLFNDMRTGAGGLALAIGIVVIVLGVLPAIFLRERKARDSAVQEGPRRTLTDNLIDFGKGFITTLTSRSFQKICLATFLVFNGFIMIAAFQFYVITYYLYGGDIELGSMLAGYEGTFRISCGMAVIIVITWLGTKMGKRRAFIIATGISIFGYLLKWICYQPGNPWLILIPASIYRVWFRELIHAHAVTCCGCRR